ncbi:hypothetical protein QTV49_001802 [Vibrio vulnificus]|nr:hypothetical protein [Vibrio vulnificus]
MNKLIICPEPDAGCPDFELEFDSVREVSKSLDYLLYYLAFCTKYGVGEVCLSDRFPRGEIIEQNKVTVSTKGIHDKVRTFRRNAWQHSNSHISETNNLKLSIARNLQKRKSGSVLKFEFPINNKQEGMKLSAMLDKFEQYLKANSVEISKAANDYLREHTHPIARIY